LGRWVGTQRTSYRRQQIAQDRIEALDSIGFEWRVKENPSDGNMPEHGEGWEAMFEKLESYMEQNGDVNVPRSYPQDQLLSRWVQAQRRAKQQGRMPEDRKQQLDSIGFAWDNTENTETTASNEGIWNLQVSLFVSTEGNEMLVGSNF
jgi:Helicase associated domain